MKEHINFHSFAGIGFVHHFRLHYLNFTLFSTMLQITIFTRLLSPFSELSLARFTSTGSAINTVFNANVQEEIAFIGKGV